MLYREAFLQRLESGLRMQLAAWIASHAETPTAQAMGEPCAKGTVELAERWLGRHT